ncbi:hypothetical protein EJ05DRAFT_497719 [Pseudovirgaria hyperparasitica]|uniref:Uncharacterized protein n=1 Tax=Pseudovirgaria hyperparasitica TaxID=470096 RepID=A0A6A6WIV0_9PEZI|nr:uncharacterized protein EJ05DRAFT_497719 [Pseudovirgaria hyperparasitica]KAF2761161.1 hypothetical protein EJ05DRAFT_497719 [Pseudovirgaria hyperparasitica]
MSYFHYFSLSFIVILAFSLASRKLGEFYFHSNTQHEVPFRASFIPSKPTSNVQSTKNNGDPCIASYQDIEPLSNFDWRTTEPIKLRPFKPKFHLTMAIENTSISDLIPFDNTYLDRIRLRRRLLSTLSTEIIAAHPVAQPAVHEFYTWVFTIYLPSRYPTMFTLAPSPSAPTSLTNLITSESIPLLAPLNPLECLRTIAAHIDDDFLFLLPSPEHSTAKDQYILRAYATLFPSGFNPATKLNRTLREIHEPVPRYASKLAFSMDRFFRCMPVGRVVKRANWTVTTSRDLHVLSGTHASAAEAGGDGAGLDKAREDVDLGETVLRAERQTLHRLPGSGALVFAFKTYVYELGDVVREGRGEELACAIEGLGEGGVVGMRGYKRADVWGEKVCAFLRGGVGGEIKG